MFCIFDAIKKLNMLSDQQFKIDVCSEIGQLEGVIIHTPGP